MPRRELNAPDSDVSDLGPEDWFLWSRIDGKTTIRELFTLSGQSREGTIEALRRLADRGLVQLPGREPPAPRKGKEQAATLPRPDFGTPFETFRVDPEVLEADLALPVEMRKLVTYYHHHLEKVTYYDLLQVEREAEVEALKDAYYRLSKLFHPDRWFRRPLGSLEMPLRDVFAWINKAYRALADKKRRQEYDGLLAQGLLGPWQLAEGEGLTSSRAKAEVSVSHGLGRNALLAQGRRCRSEGQYGQAVDCLRRAQRLAPDDKLSLELAEVMLEGRIQLKEALQYVRDVQGNSAQNYAAMLLEARILGAMGRREAARKVCRAILATQPNHLAAKAELKALEEK